MSNRSVKNVSASVRERLLYQAKIGQRPFDELLQYFAMERFLYRWSKSAHASSFILKGALMLRVWHVSDFRSTRDIDMLARGTSNDLESMIAIVKEVIATDVAPDGLVFLSNTVAAERITEEADYEGVRIKFAGMLGNARVTMQTDIGFGDIVYPAPEETQLPSMLDFPQAQLLCYSRESAIAEKLQAMVYLGDANSRMKDFYDIYILSRQFDFKAEELAKAIQLTFSHRATQIPEEISSFQQAFIDSKESQWRAFRRKIDQDHVPESFDDIVTGIASFIVPIVGTLTSHVKINGRWVAPGPWK